jgi:hypothetical protein
MSYSQEQRQLAYRGAPEEVRELYGSEVLGTALQSTASKLGNNYKNFVGIIGDIVLGLEQTSAAYTALTSHYGLSDTEARNILKIIEQDVKSPLLNFSSSEQKTIVPGTSSPTATIQPHLTPSRVMPQSAAEVAHDPKGATELPNALLQNLKASLMHGGAPEEPLDGTGPKAAYTTMLNSPPKPPQQPG